MKRYGTTYNFYLTWEDTIMTYDPDNIKVCDISLLYVRPLLMRS
jgi:hypothetical protein